MWELTYDFRTKTDDLFLNICDFEDDYLTSLAATYVRVWELLPRQNDLLDYLTDCYTLEEYSEMRNIPLKRLSDRKKRAINRYYERYPKVLKLLLKMEEDKFSIKEIPETKREPFQRLYKNFKEGLERHNE
jgi:hypothetical protein